MAFPQTILPIKAELRLGSTWTDVTSYVRGEQQIRIQRGRSDWGQQVDTSRCSFTLDNNDGRFTPGNPVGAYYGQIGRNTPCRVSVMTGDTYLDLPGTSTSDYAETVDHASLDITGDIDVRFDASLANWLLPSGASGLATVELIGKYQVSTQRSWVFGTRDGFLYFEWSNDGSAVLSATSTVSPVIPGGLGRLAVRVTLDVDNGASGNTATFYTAATIDGPWTQLGDPVVQSGTTSIFSSTSPVRIGNASNVSFNLPLGRCHAAEVRSGIGGSAVANPVFTGQTAGAASFADAAGRTWTMNGQSQITDRQTRFVGEVSAWNVRWETRFDVVTNVEASGIMRRMAQGDSPLRSAMFREFSNSARANVVAYWPMEDEASATEFASAMDGHPPMRLPVTGGVTPAAYSDWVASAGLPTYSSGVTKVVVPPYVATNYLFTRLFVEVPAGGVTGTDRLFSVLTTGSARTWSVHVNTSGNLQMRAFDEDGAVLADSGFVATAINGQQIHLAVELTQDGADVDWQMVVLYIDDTVVTVGGASGTLTTDTFGVAAELRIGQSGLLNGTAVGHLALADLNTAYEGTAGAMIGWNGEAATKRLSRLGTEELTPVFAASASDESMGVQSTATLLELMREAEAVDEGILYESRVHYPAFRFRDHVSLYNQAPVLVLDYEGGDGLVTPLDPTDDDQLVRNDRTVQRTGGSSTRRTLDTGTLSTQVPPDGVGRYDDSVTENLFEDSQTGEHAGWLLHLGTWDETRYPVAKIKLQAAPLLIADATAVDIGDRMHIENPPSSVPPDTIDLMVQGYTEILDQFRWEIDFNCTPAGPWDVTWVGDSDSATSSREFAWVDTDGSQLAEALTTTETDIDVLTTTGPTWTPNVADTPFDWRVSGEVMTVTAPGGLINTNPFFDTDTTGWSTNGSTFTWSQAIVNPHPRALGSLRIVPDGASASGGANGTLTAAGTVTPGATYIASMWVYSPAGWSDLRPAVDWSDAAGSFLSSGLGSATVVPAGVWTYIEQTLTAPASASRVTARARHGGTPAASDVYHVWGVRVTRPTSSWLKDGFTRSSASGWGTADTGNAWTTSGGSATDYTLSGTYAAHVLASVDVARRTGIAAPNADFDIYCDITASAAATGASLFGAVAGRMLDANNLYMARLEFTTGNAAILSVRKIVAGVETQLGTYTLHFAHVAGTFIRLRFQGSGSALRAKAWRTTDVEPGVWRVDTTDSALTAANEIGTRSIRLTGNTNAASVEVRFDNYELVNPQTYVVTRSQNGVVKAQASGAAVALAHPAYLAL